MTHPPPKRGVPRAAFAAAAAFLSPPSHVHGGVPAPMMSYCPIRRTCASEGGAFWYGFGGRGGAGQGVQVSRRGGGGGFAGEVLQGLPGVGGLNPQLDSRIFL